MNNYSNEKQQAKDLVNETRLIMNTLVSENILLWSESKREKLLNEITNIMLNIEGLTALIDINDREWFDLDLIFLEEFLSKLEEFENNTKFNTTFTA